MNEVFEILMYLFENHMHKDCQILQDKRTIADELRKIGYPNQAINKALDWLNGLVPAQKNVEEASDELAATRIFIPHECERLDEQCRGFLLSLEQIGILDSVTRELVIDRLLALEVEEIGLPEVKWVTLMVLFNQPDRAAALACMERLILKDELGSLH